MTDAEQMANKLCGQSVFEIDEVLDIEYPPELNAFIIVTTDGKKYLVEVSDYIEDYR